MRRPTHLCAAADHVCEGVGCGPGVGVGEEARDLRVGGVVNAEAGGEEGGTDVGFELRGGSRRIGDGVYG